MFPKPIGNNRSAPGTYNGGSYGTSYESYTGTTVVNSTLAINNQDASDVEEFEYWNGSAWVSIASFGAYIALGYFVGTKIRSRIVNAYFGSATAYVEGTTSGHEDTGGSGSISLVAPTVPFKPAYISPGFVRVEYTVDTTMTSARNLYGATVFVNASYVGVDALQHQVNVTLPWPASTATQLVDIATPDAADPATTANPIWFSQVVQTASWVDSGPTASVTTTTP